MDWTNNATHLMCQIAVATEGWFAVATNPNARCGMCHGADVWTFYVDESQRCARERSPRHHRRPGCRAEGGHAVDGFLRSNDPEHMETSPVLEQPLADADFGAAVRCSAVATYHTRLMQAVLMIWLTSLARCGRSR
jgi:hypothetical protein